ncbi:MAG: AAA family ATPase [Pseudomonadales bacterium]
MSLRIASYQVDELIYESDNSLVYRGHQEEGGQKAILKVLKQDYPTPQELTRYKQEYQLTHDLEAPNVVRAYGLEKYQNTLVIFLEDFGGHSLSLLFENQQLPIKQFLELAVLITEALQQVHKANVIHKDINPSNIILNQKTGQLKLIDFGISTKLSRENLTIQNPRGLEGTLPYMSPEQTGRMNRFLDYRTDLYSLGATFYKLLTGRAPFEGDDALEIVHQHLAKSPKLPQRESKIPEVVSEIVLKLLAKNAEDRYQSAQSIKADLEICLTQWQEIGQIEPFTLAQQATIGNFQISQKLYGRETEIKKLVTAFEQVSQGNKKLMLVAGYSGIGKTSLVQEVHRFVTQQRGYYIAGKFDQLQRNIPYRAIASAFQDLVRQLLTESETELQQWKEKLLASLGQNGQLIIDVIPEVEWIIGEQPPMPELAPIEAQNIFNLVFQRFIQVFCQAEHPLIIFLDDLQWADLATLKLMKLMLQDEDTSHLFLIGAYRDNEVQPTHSLMVTVEELRESGSAIDQITLSPLSLSQLTLLVADTLSQASATVEPLAKLIMDKTQGNPFFINQFLSTLHQEDLLIFNSKRLAWQWDLDQIEAMGVTDDVADLMGRNLKKMPEHTQSALRLAACIGNQFDLNTLAIIQERSGVETFSNLSPALFDGLIQPLSAFEVADQQEIDSSLVIHDYKFLHDRVQQAAYALIDEDQRKTVHLKIGRLLLANMTAEEREDRLFELVDHFNQGQESITEDEEIELLKLNLEAGRRAKEATAYAAAQRYLMTALKGFKGDIWADQYDLAFALHEEVIEVEYLNSNIEESKALIEVALERTRTAVEKAKLLHSRVLIFTLQAKYEDAIVALRDALALLNITLPDEGGYESALEVEMSKIETYFENRPIASAIDKPEIANAEKRQIVTLVNGAMPAVFLANRLDLFSVMVAKGVNTCLQHGYTTKAPYVFSGYGIVLVAKFKEYQTAYEFSQLALNISEKLNDLASRCQASEVHIAHIHHWSRSLATSIPFCNESYQAGLLSGGVQWLSYLCMFKTYNQAASGKRLERLLDQEIHEGLVFTRKMKNQMANDVILGAQLATWNLLGMTSDKFSFQTTDIDEAQYIERCQTNRSMLGLCLYKILKAQIFYLYGRLDEAHQYGEEAGELLAIPSFIAVAEHNFYMSLILAARYLHASAEDQSAYWQRLEANQVQMKNWADNCEANFHHKYLLVAAEMARLSGQNSEAVELYNQAIQSAKANDFTQNEALANELAGKFWLSQGQHQYAAIHMTEAHYGYQLWGAKRKAADFIERYPELLARRSVTTSQDALLTTRTAISTIAGQSGALDLTTILRSSQAIYSEIDLEKLLIALINNAIENAGAQRGCLILEKDEQWVIEADASVGQEETAVLQSIPIDSMDRGADQSCLVSSAIVHYVIRTGEYVVLRDASQDEQFSTDVYISNQQARSVLCMPLVNQGQVSGILYLENNLNAGAFTVDRLAVLEVLSSQMAISLDKARLYRDLQQHRAHLAELVEELETKNMELERFVYTVSHELKSPLVTISGFAGILLNDVAERNSERMENDVQHITSAIDTMSNLLTELLEMSRIGRVVNPSESIALSELVQHAWNFVSLQAAERDVTIVVLPDLPVVYGDRVRLREVLQNLIENAIKFRGDNPEPRIEIGSRDEGAEVVCYVRDNGLGINPDYHERIFDLFERLDPKVDGTGIGLALARRIVELHGGKLWVESEGVGKGSTFFFTIPQVKESQLIHPAIHDLESATVC